MLIRVHTWGFWRRSGSRIINTDHIKMLEATTIGNFAHKSNAKITFTDGEVLKVVTSVEDIQSFANCGKPAFGR